MAGPNALGSPRSMKRQREEDDGGAVAMQAAAATFSYQSPLRQGVPRAPWGVTMPVADHMTPVKRQRDRSVPMDAMSRLMTAAASAARMKKRAQMTFTTLFGAKTVAHEAATRSCDVCSTATSKKIAVPSTQMQRCAHCERAMGPCCARDCDVCASAFCSNCSTINCDEQFDRVFCLSCNYDVSR